MDVNEIKNLIDRFKNGESSAEEDLEIIKSMNSSLEVAKLFLDEVKVAKIKQSLSAN